MNKVEESSNIDELFRELLEIDELSSEKKEKEFSRGDLNNYFLLDDSLEDQESIIDESEVDSGYENAFFISDLFDSPNSDVKITENDINNSREYFLSEKVSPELINLINEEDFEFGFVSRSEELINKQLEKNDLATRNWLNELFISNFKNDGILIGLLRIIGRFDQEIIFPQGQTMALAALSHRNNEIKELGIRAFENWASKNSIQVLRNTNLELGWLNEYKNEVIADLEDELCLI